MIAARHPPIFRRAGRDDLPGILVLYRELNPEDPELDPAVADRSWTAIERQGVQAYFVADAGGTLAGSCNVTIVPNLTRGGRPFGVIENVVVGQAFRRQGIGRRLLELAVEHCREWRCYKVVLLSSRKRTEAHRFYEAAGFDAQSKLGFEMRL